MRGVQRLGNSLAGNSEKPRQVGLFEILVIKLDNLISPGFVLHGADKPPDLGLNIIGCEYIHGCQDEILPDSTGIVHVLVSHFHRHIIEN